MPRYPLQNAASQPFLAFYLHPLFGMFICAGDWQTINVAVIDD